MTAQKPNRTADGRLACALGELFTGPHPLCRAETARSLGVHITDVPRPDYSAYAGWAQQNLFPPTSSRETRGVDLAQCSAR